MGAPRKYPDELRECAGRLYRESEPKPVIRRLADQLGVHHEALRNWIRQDQADQGEQPSTDMVEENRRLIRENAELSGSTKCCGLRVLISPRRSARPGGGHELHRRP